MDNKIISPILELQRQRALLEKEYQADKEAYRRQTEQTGLAKKVRQGDAWFPLRTGRSYYNSLNQLVVEVYRDTDSDTDHHFEPGRPVCFFRVKQQAAQDKKAKEAISYFNFTCTVSYVDGSRMVVCVPDSNRLLELEGCSDSLGVQLFFDETSYRTMFAALDRVMKGKGRLGYLRDLFYSRQKAERYTFQPLHFPYLNATQEKAVNEVLWAKDVAIVHGPPGTGKTTTLVEAIYETLRRESQVLVCAQSNMAVDWIAEKLVDRGVNVLRIGNPTKVNDKMLGFTYERRFEGHPDYPQLWAIRKAIRELRSHRKRDDNWHQKMERLKSRAAELEIRINSELFGEARVIASTLVGSANRLLDGMKFGTLFIDEAAQALEAACWIPMRRASRLVLAGDHCQLPPTVKSLEALRGGLGRTLMERLVENKPEVVTLLKTQYRMNEDIMRFSSDWFYHGEVESAPEVSHRGILDYDVAMEWVEVTDTPSDGTEATEGLRGTEASREETGQDHTSYANPAEATLTLDTLETYFDKIGRERIDDERIDVGIISPYRGQVQLLRRMLSRRERLKPFRKRITVNTVDGFQGQERDIILISLVRHNDEGRIGFLNDLRRMNVAITRARMKVIILGDKTTLTHTPFYRKLWEYVKGLSGAK